MIYERKELGNFSNVVCFKAVIVGVEDTLGADAAGVVFKRAGHVRGQNLAKDLGLANSNIPVEKIGEELNKALGKEGTKLCAINKAYQQDGKIIVETAETVCSAGEEEGSDRQCTFTLGAVWGALETITGQKLEAKHTGSVLRGGNADVFEFTPA